MTISITQIHTEEDLLCLRESVDIEFKKAQGKDNKGQVPKSFWETYSAFANTEGGYLFLGVEQKQEKIKVTGIESPERLKQDIFNQANNTQKVSVNLLADNSVRILSIGGKNVIQVYIPRASRQDRPVYLNENPLKGSYKRCNEGDYSLGEHKVKKMLAEQEKDSADGLILKGFTIADLNIETVNAYKNVFASRDPDHAFLSKDLPDFLRAIGAYSKDRASGDEGLTLAGLLMFGNLTSILEEEHNYILDYQDKPEEGSRWSDRITTDGTWSGNIYDFYRKVFPKLTSDLKIPFKLEGDTRVGTTPVHEALREAFVNTLIHADYSGRVSVLISKAPGCFSFRNPGLMRISIEQSKVGGNSDCRNRKLQKMFQFIGVGDQAGSGIPTIYQNWEKQHWRAPLIKEKQEPEQTICELRTVSLLDENMISILDKKFDQDFRRLDNLERVILTTALSEVSINHKRILEITSEHPSDISKSLSLLSKAGFLYTHGSGRGTSYSISEKYNTDDKRSKSYRYGAIVGSSEGLEHSSEGLEHNSEGLEHNSEGLERSSEGTKGIEEIILQISDPARKKKKLPGNEMKEIIEELCGIKPHTIRELASLLDRSYDFLRSSYIEGMIKNKRIEPIHKENHPKQAYRKCHD